MPIRNEKQGGEVNAEEAISVTVDATDLTAASAEPLRAIVRRYGRPVSAKAFADFQQPGLAELAIQLYQMGFTLVHCPSWPNGDGYPKSIVSDVMAQDLRDQLEQLEGVETYLLVATSRDYIAVTNALKRHEARVIVIAEESKVCKELRNCAEEFVALPAVRVEAARYSRLERLAEQATGERIGEATRVERSGGGSRGKRSTDATRSERAETVRVERITEQTKVEPEVVRLPSDAEVLAEVKRIVAAEGICTPRRLARALCPVDRTPTGELRSRIANRIQALIDNGKLIRERLVVGGTSVETILVREDRNGRDLQPALPDTAALLSANTHAVTTSEPDLIETVDSPIGVDESGIAELVPELHEEHIEAELETAKDVSVRDLDAFVESVLRSSEFAPIPSAVESEPEAATPELTSEPAPQETPKRSRPRRRTSKTAATDTNGAA